MLSGTPTAISSGSITIRATDLYGCYGERITEPNDIVAALQRGIAATERGEPVADIVRKCRHTGAIHDRTIGHIAIGIEQAAGADIVFCCVGNDNDLRAVVLGADGALAGMKPGAVFVDHTTASADVARELYQAARQIGLQFIDAPVSGGQAGAENGKLTIMVGGTDVAFAAAEPVMKSSPAPPSWSFPPARS